MGKALTAFGISPGVLEVFFTDHEEQVNKAKFAEHCATYGISYDTDDEYQLRMDIYKEHDKQIEEINLNQSSYVLSHNHLSTWTADEYNNVKGEDPTMGVELSTLTAPTNW